MLMKLTPELQNITGTNISNNIIFGRHDNEFQMVSIFRSAEAHDYNYGLIPGFNLVNILQTAFFIQKCLVQLFSN